jgi:RimJ/RimL family protein N-acetyltransferase
MICELIKVLQKQAKKVYRNNRLMFFSSVKEVGTWSENVTEFDSLLSLPTNSPYCSRIGAELRSGAQIYCIYDNDNISHFSCVSRDNRYVGEINRRIKLCDGDVYIYNCYTDKDYRGKGLYAETLRHIIHKYRGRRIIIACLDGNTPSLRTIEKVGFKNCGYITYFRIFFYERFNNKTVFNFLVNK